MAIGRDIKEEDLEAAWSAMTTMPFPKLDPEREKFLISYNDMLFRFDLCCNLFSSLLKRNGAGLPWARSVVGKLTKEFRQYRKKASDFSDELAAYHERVTLNANQLVPIKEFLLEDKNDLQRIQLNERIKVFCESAISNIAILQDSIGGILDFLDEQNKYLKRFENAVSKGILIKINASIYACISFFVSKQDHFLTTGFGYIRSLRDRIEEKISSIERPDNVEEEVAEFDRIVGVFSQKIREFLVLAKMNSLTIPPAILKAHKEVARGFLRIERNPDVQSVQEARSLPPALRRG
ncbi:MAG TPA: hypothetical protein VNC84_07780 [Gammaproteobacteria bacterium]|jgi:hypothetical protein|nr:hypothetical protein [Gammaproteobacteria bacterium]